MLDLASEPENPIVCTRAFGDDPETVQRLGAAMIRGLQDGGVLATAKHFPGHGRTRLDSHDRLPVEASVGSLRSDLLPFRHAVQAGVALVMSAHVAFPALELPDTPTRPATLSSPILRGLLRDDLGFRGVIVSDALIMGAVHERTPLALAQALEAGTGPSVSPEPRRIADALARLDTGGRMAELVSAAAVRLEAALDRAAPTADELPLPGARQLAFAAADAAITAVGGPLPPPRTGARSC